VGRGGGGRRGNALGFHHRFIGLRNAVPALVAIHREIAPDDGGNAHARNTGQISFEALQILRRGARRRVPPIGKAVDGDRNASA
jgi:hypothetical protein